METYEDIHLPWPDWKIVKSLGKGGFGQVYEIERELAGLKEKAALKKISRPTDSELEMDYDNGYDEKSVVKKYSDMLQKYIGEYKVMMAMKGQSNIVSCDDLGVVQHENGIGWDIFIRMELLTPLKNVARKKAFSEQDVIKVGQDICSALMLCESKNIIHRDIKPDNIMVSEFGDYKLGDFGQARIMDHTTQGTQTGTPDYWAPEVKEMRKYGKEADIYSLGIVLYWLLNNRKMPFLAADETPRLDTVEEARERRYRGEKLPAPRGGSPSLKRIVLKACEYKPEDRYRSAREMYRALEGIGNGQAGDTAELSGSQGNDSATERPGGPGGHSTVNPSGSQYAGDSGHQKTGEGNHGDGQTEGNSWGNSVGSIGSPGGNAKKERTKSDRGEAYTQTVGVKNAHQKESSEKSCAQELFEAVGGTNGYFYHVDTWMGKSIFLSFRDSKVKKRVDIRKILQINEVKSARFYMLDLIIKFHNQDVRDQVIKELLEISPVNS